MSASIHKHHIHSPIPYLITSTRPSIHPSIYLSVFEPQGVQRASHDFQQAGRAAEEVRAITTVYKQHHLGLDTTQWHYALPRPAEPPSPVLHLHGASL
jgi:hypothetical protein